VRTKILALFAVVLFEVVFSQDIAKSNTPFKQESPLRFSEPIDNIITDLETFIPNYMKNENTQRRFVEDYLYSYFERLDASGISYYSMLGNDDCQAVLPNWQALVKTYPRLHDLTEEWIPLADDLAICGCNYIPDGHNATVRMHIKGAGLSELTALARVFRSGRA